MRKTLSVVAAGTIAATGIFGLSAPAQAVPSVDRTCYTNYFCVYKDANYSINNSMYRFNYEDNDWADYESAIWRADSSWRNYRSEKWLVCDYGVLNDTQTIVLSSGQGIASSSAANDRGEGDELYTNNDC